MDSSAKSSPTTDKDVETKAVSSDNNKRLPTIIINSIPDDVDDDLTVTPAFPNFPTDEEIVMKPDSVVFVEPTDDISEQENEILPTSTNTQDQPSQQSAQILDELKYLLKPTNSLANQEITIQESQEVDSAIKRRATQLSDDFAYENDRFLIERLTPKEERSLSAAERRSIASQGHRVSSSVPFSDRSRARSMQPPTKVRSFSEAPTIVIAQPENRSIADRLAGIFWALFAAYGFSIILFLIKYCGIDLTFGFFLQMAVQTIAFAIYAIYKDYNLLGPQEYRLAMIVRAILIGIGVLTSFLAYYYISLPELSAIRQSQVIFTIVLSIFFLHERITVSRIIACILTIIAIIVLIRPTNIGGGKLNSSFSTLNSTNTNTHWILYSSTWNHIIGIGFALCTAITYSIASLLNKIYFSSQHLHNTVLCFWSALTALFISMTLVYLTHFVVPNARSFPHDWRLFAGIGLAIASIFVFIANQKAIKRERSSIVTLIYSTDIILVLLLQNLFTNTPSDAIILLGCSLVLIAIAIICVEVLIIEKSKDTLAIQIAQIANSSEPEPKLPKLAPKRSSV